MATFLDEFLPTYDVSDAVGCLVQAPVEVTWDALKRVDLIDVGRKKPLVGLLGGMRALPDLAAHLLHGERPPSAPKTLRLDDLANMPAGKGGWVRLGERQREEIALGLVGKFWRPVIEFADVAPEDFKEFDEPGFAKTIYSLATRELDEHTTMLNGSMRTATTDEQARRWFRRYWTFGVGPGAHVLVSALLEVVRDDAESHDGSS